MEKEIKKNRNIVFLVVAKKNVFFFCKNFIFRKIGKHYLCSDGKKAHFRCNYLFLENGPFFVAIPSDKTL